jgi:WD40 repeat protein
LNVSGIGIWDTATGALLAEKNQPVRTPESSFSPGLDKIAIVDYKNIITLWNATTDTVQPLRSYLQEDESNGPPVHSTAFSPDGSKVVVAFDDAIRVWDAETGALYLELEHTMRVVSAVFSSDGKQIITVSLDGTTRIFDFAAD